MKTNLSPFDSELLGMVESITKQNVIFEQLQKTENLPSLVKLQWHHVEFENVKEALEEAVKGRLGKRFHSIEYNDELTELYFYNDENELPTEYRFEFEEPKLKLGNSYELIKSKVLAVQFLAVNIGKLRAFTGGGIYTIPKGNSDASTYVFPNENGIYITAKLTDFVINDEGRFYITPKKEFLSKYQNTK